VRVVYFTETFLPKIDGIVTRLTRTLEQLRDLGHEALVFAPGKPPKEYAGHRIVNVPAIPFRPVYPELKLGLPRPRLQREMVKFQPDIVHAVNPCILGAWGVLLARANNFPLMASFHTDVPEYARRHKLYFLEEPAHFLLSRLHNMAHANLVTSPQMKGRLEGMGVDRVRIWPKAVDTNFLRPDRKTEEMRFRLSGGHPDMPLVVYVGRLSPEKRVEWLEGPVKRRKDVRFAFVGEGPGEADLKRLLENTPAVFTGFLRGEELAAAYASADVFAFPSDTETLGFVAMESMASGTPVVGARAGGLPAVIDHEETGLLFDPDSEEDFARQLDRLIDSPDLQREWGENGRRTMEKFNWRASTEKLIDYYDRACHVWRHTSGNPAKRA